MNKLDVMYLIPQLREAAAPHMKRLLQPFMVVKLRSDLNGIIQKENRKGITVVIWEHEVERELTGFEVKRGGLNEVIITPIIGEPT